MEVVIILLKYGFALVLLVETILVGRALVALAREKAVPPHETQFATEE